MRNMRQFCAVTLLLLAFSLPALADGGMETPKPQPPSTPMTTGSGMETPQVLDGGMETPVAPPIDPLLAAALSVAQSVLSLL